MPSMPLALTRRSRRIATLVSCWLVAAGSLGRAAAYTTTTVDAGRGPVTVYVPNGYSAGTPVPLLLLLHGYSSSGPSIGTAQRSDPARMCARSRAERARERACVASGPTGCSWMTRSQHASAS